MDTNKPALPWIKPGDEFIYGDDKHAIAVRVWDDVSQVRAISLDGMKPVELHYFDIEDIVRFHTNWKDLTRIETLNPICDNCEQDHCANPGNASIEEGCGGYIPMDKDEDACTSCQRGQGLCGIGTYTCGCAGHKNEGKKCDSGFDCVFGQVYNCLIGRC